jgi:hypothetical protein
VLPQASITRCSQPKTGIQARRCEEDELVIQV